MVHRREIEGQEVLFGVHGALWGNAMTWWDHSTGSVWSQPLGEAILGPLKGETLDLMTSEFTSWGAWRDEHPDTLALDAPGGSSSFDIGRMMLVVDFGAEARAYGVAEVRRQGVVNDTIAGIDIAVVSDPTNDDRWKVFSRLIAGVTVDLEVDGDVLRDSVSGSTFEPNRGFGLEGSLKGQILDQLPGFTSFPNDFHTFWPDGTIWKP
jgi:hypothetical protein